MREDKTVNRSPEDKLLIHMCYLITNRFEADYGLVLRIVKSFVEKVGRVLKGNQAEDLLLVVSQLKINGGAAFAAWTDTMGAFMKVMGFERFFKCLPLRLLDFDLNSLTYAQDSRSYLLPIVKRYMSSGDLAFYLQYFIPIINDCD